jgi:hypothetical protein
MFCIDLWRFFIDSSYFGYNSAEQENHVAVYFDVSGTFLNSN